MTIRTLIIAASAALFLAGSPVFADSGDGGGSDGPGDGGSGDCAVLVKDVRSLYDGDQSLKADVAYRRLVAILGRNLAELEGLSAAFTEAEEAKMLRKLSATNIALIQNRREFAGHVRHMEVLLQKIRLSKCHLKEMASRLDKGLEGMLKTFLSTSARIDNNIERNNKTLEDYDYLKRP